MSNPRFNIVIAVFLLIFLMFVEVGPLGGICCVFVE